MLTLIVRYHYLNLPKQNSNILFCTWTLLRACSHTWEFLLWKTLLSTSLPLGRQWRNIHFFFACFKRELVILYFLKSFNFFFTLTLSFRDITLSEKTTSAFLIEIFGKWHLLYLRCCFFRFSFFVLNFRQGASRGAVSGG